MVQLRKVAEVSSPYIHRKHEGFSLTMDENGTDQRIDLLAAGIKLAEWENHPWSCEKRAPDHESDFLELR